MVFENVILPADYCALAAGWKLQGIGLIGGCCGIGAAHIHKLRDDLDRSPACARWLAVLASR